MLRISNVCYEMKPKLNKKMLEMLVQTSQQRVLEVLYRNPEREFSLSDLAKEAGVAKPHIGKLLEALHSIGMITIVKLTKIWRIKANQENFGFVKNKIAYNLSFIYQSGLVEYLNERFENPNAIVLFGSFRQGLDLSTSDIDIALEIPEKREYEVLTLPDLTEFERHIGRKIQLHVFSREAVDLNVFNSIANGIVLLGFLEVKP